MSHNIFSLADARALAKRRLPKLIFDFVDGGAGDESACRLNISQLDAIRLLPRVLVNVEKRNLNCPLLGRNWGLPFGIAPMGMCNLTWPDADKMLARAARRYDIPMVLSTMASTSIESAAADAADHAWFQLYVGQSEELAYSLVDRAEAAGYRHLVLTVDVPEIGLRPREQRNGFQSPIRIGAKQLIDFVSHPGWSLATLRCGIPKLANINVSGSSDFKRDEARGKVDWAFLERLRQRWKGSLIVKGVLSCEDSVRMRDAGIDAVYVSNHGGRQLGAVAASIQMLPRIRAAVGADYPLLFDSGVRSGEDVLRALALGADFVFMGRPFLYAIGAGGYDGLRQTVELIRDQVDISLAQIGCIDINDIDERYILDDVAAMEVSKR